MRPKAAELAEARECLCEVYGRLTEAFAFPDLQDAAALIGETEQAGPVDVTSLTDLSRLTELATGPAS